MALALMRSGPRVGGFRKVTWETREERPISALVPADLIAPEEGGGGLSL